MVTSKLSVFIFILIAFSQSVFATTRVTATVDRNPAILNESIVLEVIADDSLDSTAFNSRPLMQDFIVGNTSVSSHTQIINGDMSRTTKWTTLLIPRQAGKILIPSFTIDGISSQPIELEVIAANAQANNQHKELFIDSQVDIDSVFVQQMISYTVKLYIATDLQSGSLTEPAMPDATINQVGKDKETNEIVNGKRYRVIERVYSITPQKSGTFTISGVVFNGEVVESTRRRSFFNSMTRTKPISRVGNDIEIEVQPIPDNYPENWLPSEFVTITEEWQPIATEYKVGEPITRTVSLTAVGVNESILPEITFTADGNIKIYADQAKSTSVQRNGKVISQRVESAAFVPNQSGEYTLPEISVPWFNTITKEINYATLPAKTITVTGQAINQTLATNDAQPLTQNSDVTDSVESLTTPSFSVEPNVSFNLLTLLSLGLWLLTLLAWLLHVKYLKQNHTADIPKKRGAEPSTPASGKAYWNKMQSAVKADDTNAFYRAMLTWFNCVYHPLNVQSVEDIKKVLQTASTGKQRDFFSDLEKQLNLLNYALYSSKQLESNEWHGAQMMKLLKQLQQEKSITLAHKTTHPIQLEPLNP
ncbi:BatD family protein [Flocculibacter collagenilyticus]|uniref:BatD family protein n=1 Tax=Flocculibacter collagenilyticus TaxID=2744479 RepID=UPI0018F40B75|nr:BatD family protein [Flocculibacter collagenilyticus]